jgi:magnesium and cobalt exporter, CNNM family
LESEIVIRLFILVILLLLSSFFSGSEVAFFSLEPLFKKKAAVSKKPCDKRLLWLLNRPRRLIITLLVGNEIVNISASTISATLGSYFFSAMGQWERTILSIVLVVPLILIVGEITPKTIAILNSNKWAKKVATPIYLFSKLISPIIFLFQLFTNFLVKLSGSSISPKEKPVTEQDFLMLVEKGYKLGNINDHEEDLIKNVFRFGDTQVKGIMTPKDKIFSISSNIEIDQIIPTIIKGTYSRVPVIKDRTGEIVGILHVKHLLGIEPSIKNSLKDLIQPPFYVSQNTKCLRLLNEFQNRRIHLAVVLDQKGSVAGLVTLEDLLEELVGEIHDEKERITLTPNMFSGEVQ